MAYIEELVRGVKADLARNEVGRRLLGSWSDGQIKTELKDPCFFGVKNEITDMAKAVRHFQKIAAVRDKLKKV